MERVPIALTVNGTRHVGAVEPRTSLADFLRDDLGLTGLHLSCELGACGACTVLVDGHAVRACLMLAVQAGGADVLTVEGLAGPGGLHPLQEAFWEHHALQCGFCTPGMLLAAYALLRDHPDADEGEIREGIAGNLCRCTGYVHIVQAIRAAGERMMPLRRGG